MRFRFLIPQQQVDRVSSDSFDFHVPGSRGQSSKGEGMTEGSAPAVVCAFNYCSHSVQL